MTGSTLLRFPEGPFSSQQPGRVSWFNHVMRPGPSPSGSASGPDLRTRRDDRDAQSGPRASQCRRQADDEYEQERKRQSLPPLSIILHPTSL
jgi:hypothetical protein